MLFCTIFTPPLTAPDENGCFPSVLLWNPLLSHRLIVNIKCPDCGSNVDLKQWNDGSCPSRQPRLLHEVETIVFLIGCVYRCPLSHECMSHDARILRQLSEVGCEIPFVLLHRTGFMTSFVELCYTLVTSGMNFYNLESMIIERRWSNYAKKMKVVSDTCTLQDCSSENFLQSCLANSPSNSILTQCFIAMFNLEEHLYICEMESINIGTSISFDHTFKVAANIGYYRKDKVWVTQFLKRNYIVVRSTSYTNLYN